MTMRGSDEEKGVSVAANDGEEEGVDVVAMRRERELWGWW